MGIRRVFACLAIALVLVFGGVAQSWAAGWCAPVPGGAVMTGFGVPRASGVHRGVDLAADPGCRVVSPASGRVLFAGPVPADGGGRCNAVTVELADGLRISLLPLESVVVSEGDTLAAGDLVGSLAASGDDSHGDTHLHVSLRTGETYLDPTGYLPAAAAAEPASGGEAPVSGAPSSQTVAPGAPAAAPSAAAATVAAEPSAAPVARPMSVAAVQPSVAPAAGPAAAPAGRSARVEQRLERLDTGASALSAAGDTVRVGALSKLALATVDPSAGWWGAAAALVTIAAKAASSVVRASAERS